MENSHRQLLNDHLVVLATDLDPSDIYAHLIEGKVLTADDVELVNAQVTRREKVLKLMFMLPRRGPHAFEIFAAALGETYPHLRQMLLPHLEGGGSNGSASADIFADIRDELKAHYKACLRDIYTAPWLLECPLDLQEVYVRLRLQTSDHLTNPGVEVTQDRMFVPRQKQERPTRILVEGDPGIGKSTLCQKLTYEWSNDCCEDQCRSFPCIHSFHLVLLLTAADFRGYRDLHNVVLDHLLPEDSQLSVSTVVNALNDRYVLIVVDGYDEACTDNPLLHDLIQRKLASNSTVLLTSRPNYLREMLKHFDTKLYVDGFDAQQRQQYVEKFARHVHRPLSEFEYLLDENSGFADLCCTPLNIAIVCLTSTMDDAPFSNRTDLYQSVHDFILDKSSVRLNLSREDIDRTIISPLCRLSFEAGRRGDAVLLERELREVSPSIESFCQAGYLIRKLKVSRMRGEIRFSFTHRTFQEFLSAMHIKQLPEPERQVWLNSVNLEKNESTLSFLFGLLEDNEEALVSMASITAEKTGFSLVNPFGEASCLPKCPRSHLLLRSLHEVKVMPSTLGDVVSQKSPSVIYLNHDCSSNCMKAIAKFFSIAHLTVNSVSLVINRHRQVNNIIFLLGQITKCKSVARVTLVQPDNLDLSRLLNAMRVGHSFVRNVQIDDPTTTDLGETNKHFEDLTFGEDTLGVELADSMFTNLSLAILRSAQNKPLTTFGMYRSELNDECVHMMLTVLKNPLLQNVSVSPSKSNRTDLISLLADLKDLRSLEINVSDLNAEDWAIFGRLLQNRSLQRLTLTHCEFSKECCDVLISNFLQMPSLKFLSFKSGWIGDKEGFGRVLLAASGLEMLNIDHVTFNGQDVELLSDVLPTLPSLKALSLSFVPFLHQPMNSYQEACKLAHEQQTKPPNRQTFARQKVIRAIAQCSRLEFLSLSGMPMFIGDDTVKDLCDAVTSLRNFRHLRLSGGNRLTALGLSQLSELKSVFLET